MKLLPGLAPRLRVHAPAPVLRAPLLAALLLAGCASFPAIEFGGGGAAVPAAAPATPAASADPMLAFAAGAAPGTESVVQGQRVRLARAYHAASGRDCRELLVGSGMAERSAIACRDDVTGWEMTRPLLRGGGITRP